MIYETLLQMVLDTNFDSQMFAKKDPSLKCKVVERTFSIINKILLRIKSCQKISENKKIRHYGFFFKNNQQSNPIR